MPARPRPPEPGKSRAAQKDAFLKTRDGVFYPGGHAVLLLAPEDAHALRDALGAAMLIVRVDGDERQDALVAAARRWRVRKAVQYHALAIEELRIGAEEIPGESPYGVNEVLRSKASDARMTPRNRRRGERS